jgi:endonuclease YncB( thermonuclease family)
MSDDDSPRRRLLHLTPEPETVTVAQILAAADEADEADALSADEDATLQLSAFGTVAPFLLETVPGNPVRCKVVDVYDSDTCRVNVFLPRACARCSRAPVQLTLRLRRVDGPELRSRSAAEKKAALAARDALVAFVLGGPIPAVTGGSSKKPKARLRRPDIRMQLQCSRQPAVRVALRGVDKYGRVLAELFNRDLTEAQNASDWLLRVGAVHAYDGAKKRRFTDAQLAEITAAGARGDFVPA